MWATISSPGGTGSAPDPNADLKLFDQFGAADKNPGEKQDRPGTMVCNM